MTKHRIGTAVKLKEHWNLSGVLHQMKSIFSLHESEPDQVKSYRLDCSEISCIDMIGLQFLYVWMQCARMRGIKAELVNLPKEMRQTITLLGLDNCFSEYYPAGQMQ